MKLIGKLSLASFLSDLTDVARTIMLIGLIVLPILLIVFLVIPGGKSWNTYEDFSALYNISPPLYKLSGDAIKAVPAVMLEDINLQASMDIKFNSPLQTILIFIWAYVFTYVSFYILSNLQKLFKSIEGSGFFKSANTLIIKKIAWAVILLQAGAIVFSTVLSLYLGSIFSSETFQINLNWNIFGNIIEESLRELFTGLILLVVSELFHVAARMKEEQDLTV